MFASRLVSSKLLHLPSRQLTRLPLASARLTPRPSISPIRRYATQENPSNKSEGLAADLLRKKMADEGQEEAKQETEKEAPKPQEPRGNLAVAWMSILTMGTLGVLLVAGWPGEGQSWTSGWLTRARGTLTGVWKTYSEPMDTKLLPDPLPDPYGRPNTLVINLNDTLTRLEWTPDHGWRAAKRPGVDFFLAYLSQFYEIVVFTDAPAHEGEALLSKLDPFGYIMYRLYRDSTRYEKGNYIKDLSHLNRDLSKLIAIDVDPVALKEQPENAMIIPRWDGNPNDTYLLDMIPLLEWISLFRLPDVRVPVNAMHGKDPLQWYQVKMEDMKQEWEKAMSEMQAQKATLPGGAKGAVGFLGKLVARGPIHLPEASNPLSPVERLQESTKNLRKMFLEDSEKYREMVLKEHAEQMKAMQEQMEAMKGQKRSMFDFFKSMEQQPQPAK